MTGKKLGIIVLFAVFLLIIVPSTSAAITNPNWWWGMNNSHIDTISSIAFASTFTYSTTEFNYGNASVIINQDNAADLAGGVISTGEDVSWTGWFWQNGDILAGDLLYPFQLVEDGGANERSWVIADGGNFKIGLLCNAQGAVEYSISKDLFTNNWTHIVLTFDNSENNLSFYVNKKLMSSTTGCSDIYPMGQVEMASHYSAGEDSIYVDNIMIWDDYVLTESEIDEIYDLNVSGAPPPSGGDDINVSTPNPVNGTQFNVSIIDINVTYNATNAFNVSLMIDGVANVSNASVNAGTDVFVNFTLDFGNSQNVNYSFRATDLTTGFISNTTYQQFHVDIVQPNIVTNFTNNFTSLQSNITGQFNFTDDYSLFSYNLTIDNGYFNIANGTISGTNYMYNLTFNHSLLDVPLIAGQHTINARIADGHTAKKLRGNYTVERGLFKDWIRFYTYENVWAKITVEDGSVFDNWDYSKKVDRYTFDYQPFNTNKENYTFLIESNKHIYIHEEPNTELGTWLVLDGQHWLDFFIPEDPNIIVTYDRWTNKKVYVNIINVTNKDNMSFQSIGDLNIIDKQYNFSVVKPSFVYNFNVESFVSQTINFSINRTDVNVTTNVTQFIYNGSNVSFDKTTLGEVDTYTATFFTPPAGGQANAEVNFTWVYNITGVNNGETGNFTNNQTILFIGVDNCSTYTTIAVNFTIWNETSNQPQVADLEMYMETWNDNIANFTSFNMSWSNASVYSLCVSPSTANYSIYAQMKYSNVSAAYDDKLYYLTNMTIDNVTQIIPLYLTFGTTQTTFNVRDEDDDPIENAIVKILSYDIGTDTYIVTEIVRTDTQGVGLAQIIRDTKFYQFVVEVSGVPEFFSQPQKITSADNTFRLTLAGDYFDNYDIANNIASSLTYDNNTNSFTFIFTDTTGTVRTGCLEVIRRTYNGDSVINQSCVTSSAGSITLSIGTPSTTGSYLAKGTININPVFVAELLGQDFNTNFAIWGDEGIFVSFLLVTGIVMVGLFSPLVAVFLLMIGVIFTLLLGTFHLTFQFLIAFIILGGITIYRMRR